MSINKKQIGIFKVAIALLIIALSSFTKQSGSFFMIKNGSQTMTLTKNSSVPISLLRPIDSIEITGIDSSIKVLSFECTYRPHRGEWKSAKFTDRFIAAPFNTDHFYEKDVLIINNILVQYQGKTKLLTGDEYRILIVK